MWFNLTRFRDSNNVCVVSYDNSNDDSSYNYVSLHEKHRPKKFDQSRISYYSIYMNCKVSVTIVLYYSNHYVRIEKSVILDEDDYSYRKFVSGY